ncbi:MAG TPA: phosphodiesterase [Xanthobacteraceae bacterium]|nr:phosphodiesterase [Xanthobacteraceae bacterium]
MLIAQLSDTHVSNPGKRFGGRKDTREAFKRALSRIGSLNPKPDLLLLSGDLAETGAPEEYDFIAEQLSRMSCPVVAIPGNHDIREEMLRKLPDYVCAQDGGHLSFVHDALPLRVIGLDTIIPGEVNGELCEQRLAWLEQALERGRGKSTLLAMHHPPVKTGFLAMDNYGIRQGTEAFASLVAKYTGDIRAIVSGHVHRTIFGSLSGVPVLVAPASSLAFELDLGERPSLNFIEEPPQFLVHRWSGESGLTSHVAFVDEFSGPFPLS